MVAENYRFFPAERTLRRMLARGRRPARCGGVCRPACAAKRTQGPWVKDGPSVPDEIAVHHFDSFRYLFVARRRPFSRSRTTCRYSDYRGRAV